MTLVDTHSHIYLNEFDNDRPLMLARAEKEGIAKILMPAIDSSTHEAMLETERQFSRQCFSMMGLHPCSVKDTYQSELDIAREHLEKRKFSAIGETGLDFYWDLSYNKQQYEVFYQQIEWALHYSIPLVIHSRNSMEKCIEIVKQNQQGKLKGVFHCFSGSMKQAMQIIDLGFYLGIGGVLTFKNSGLDAVLENLNLDHVVLETDAPYLAPVPFRGKRNECSYLKYVLQKLTEIKKTDVNEIAAITTANAEKLFGL
ncbi:MAG TPA: TatD family hydrolase [Chitinophagaceae bacterium]|nr:TatD family hydrolase [Chitinophagaceae bacterium]